MVKRHSAILFIPRTKKFPNKVFFYTKKKKDLSRYEYKLCQKHKDKVEAYFYLRQGGYVFASVSLSVCLSVCLSSTLRKKLLTNFYENFRKGPERAKEQSIRFWG